MVIEWTYTAYAQLQTYFGLSYIDTHSGGVIVGWVSLDGIIFYAS